ncbi:hypothetical protein B0A48_13896 [Cryoendolithus antarcticus]|uniref:Uncharacterized protein n=1 Tax=Cryoendolithus antarcticus TaxID=1507870 RepID=A0A1V8SLZ9_9PEZI|nr:hypothetical protein B0A48_13896 [Cryoendolithus antarcticus]
MPPATLYDSEGDDGEIIVPAQDTIDLVANFPSAGQSTGSTERLKRQLRDVQESLCLTSGEEMQSSGDGPAKARASLGSPVRQPTKRRHTETTSEPGIQWSPEKTSKRTKTLATYGRKHASTAAPLRELEANGLPHPTTSGSVRFSDHSQGEKPSGLPIGSLEVDFAEHEPAVMFRDSGSTIAFNESSHDRLVQEALGSRGANDTSVTCHTASDEQAKSSSFPRSPSAQTNATKTPQAPTQTATGEAGPDSNMMSRILAALGTVKPPADVSEADDDGSGIALSSRSAEVLARIPRTSSPVVQINVSEAKCSAFEVQPTASPSKAERGRKRKTQEPSSETLNSEDLAIGLPKERYVPRPSKRRATQAAEPSVDFSAIPEKAAKSKRRKTANADLADDTSALTTSAHEPPASTTGPTKRKTSGKAAISAEMVVEDDDDDGVAVEALSRPDADTEMPSAPARSDATSHVMTSVMTAPPQAKPSPTPSQTDDGVFLKPAPKVKAKVKASSKARRSHTTIYEDHVDFKGKDKTPTLSQQQAKRKSALQPVEVEPKASSKRGAAKRVISDDEEDELAIDAEPVKPQLPAGKSKKCRKTAGVADEQDVEAATSAVAPEETELPALDEAPKKRGRGRPAKAASKTDDPIETTELNAVDNDGETASIDTTFADKVVQPSARTNAPVSTPPEKPAALKKAAAPASTPVKSLPGKNGPVSHSPIEKSSAVPLRVGLSKTKRIPSLLKIMRPPPKHVEPKSKGRKLIVEE